MRNNEIYIHPALNKFARNSSALIQASHPENARDQTIELDKWIEDKISNLEIDLVNPTYPVDSIPYANNSGILTGNPKFTYNFSDDSLTIGDPGVSDVFDGWIWQPSKGVLLSDTAGSWDAQMSLNGYGHTIGLKNGSWNRQYLGSYYSDSVNLRGFGQDTSATNKKWFPKLTLSYATGTIISPAASFADNPVGALIFEGFGTGYRAQSFSIEGYGRTPQTYGIQSDLLFRTRQNTLAQDVDTEVFRLTNEGYVQSALYGQGNFKASDISKTKSNYLNGYATDGTFLELEYGGEFANDAGASGGGVAVGGVYYNTTTNALHTRMA